MRAPRINVVFGDNGSGLSHDAAIVTSLLTSAGCDVTLSPQSPRRYPLTLRYGPEIVQGMGRAIKGLFQGLRATHLSKWDVNLFLERPLPDFFSLARKNCVLPNQEWLTDQDIRQLSDIDVVFCKTRHALEILKRKAGGVVLVGFTSRDCRSHGVARRWRRALHVSGWNPHKGTEALVRVWRRRPDWPPLTIVSQLPLPPVSVPNIQVLTARIPDAHLRRLQNSCAIHICPSEVEGFGHTLVEAQSCGAVVVTTDAPPMNEITSPSDGFLVPYAHTQALRSGIRYICDDGQLDQTIDKVWNTDIADLIRLGDCARATFERRTARFQEHFVSAITDLASSPHY